MTDVIAGTIPLVYTAVAGAHGHIKSGKMKAIAVSSARRSGSLPEVPTFIESGVPDFVSNSWVGIVIPARTPSAIVSRLNTELNSVLQDPVVKERLAIMGIEPTPGTSAAFGQEMQLDLTRYGDVVKAAKISID